MLEAGSSYYMLLGLGLLLCVVAGGVMLRSKHDGVRAAGRFLILLAVCFVLIAIVEMVLFH